MCAIKKLKNRGGGDQIVIIQLQVTKMEKNRAGKKFERISFVVNYGPRGF